MLRPHIVILGAGFGGVYVAKKLAPYAKRGEIDLTIVNRTNYFLFTPLLHEVATGSLSPRNVAEPLREIFANCGALVIQGDVGGVNIAARTVTMKDGQPPYSLKYDYLVVATGAETNFYGIPGAAENALPLKTLADAAAIRNRVIDCFERAVTASSPLDRRSLLSFVVVGGGPTGVETAAELQEFVRRIAVRYHEDKNFDPKVTIVHSGKELLEQFAPSLRAAATGRLAKKGITVRTGAAVTAITKIGLSVTTGGDIQASTVIWTAGVKATVPHFQDFSPTLSGGRLAVDGSFRVLGLDHVFTIGDAAAYVDVQDPLSGAIANRPLPMLAQVATAEAQTVAHNIITALYDQKLQKLWSFKYRSKGSLVSVGKWFAIGNIFSINLSGRLTWWLWRTVYLFKFASWRKRARIAFEWAFELVSPRDITKI